MFLKFLLTLQIFYTVVLAPYGLCKAPVTSKTRYLLCMEALCPPSSPLPPQLSALSPLLKKARNVLLQDPLVKKDTSQIEKLISELKNIYRYNLTQHQIDTFKPQAKVLKKQTLIMLLEEAPPKLRQKLSHKFSVAQIQYPLSKEQSLFKIKAALDHYKSSKNVRQLIKTLQQLAPLRPQQNHTFMHQNFRGDYMGPGTIWLSHHAVKFPEEGLNFAAHELGHVFEWTLMSTARKNKWWQRSYYGGVLYPNPYWERRAEIDSSNLQNSACSPIFETEKLHTQEDWTDHFAVMLLQQSPIKANFYGCNLIQNHSQQIQKLKHSLSNGTTGFYSPNLWRLFHAYSLTPEASHPACNALLKELNFNTLHTQKVPGT